jgi:hypothetical protein
MGRKALISEEDELNIRALLRRHSISDSQLKKLIKWIIVELKAFAGYAGLPAVVSHLDAAMIACEAESKMETRSH